MLTLYTFAISHFAEKARWALDWSGLSYRELLLLPGPHMLTTRRLAPGTSVPLLRHAGQVVQGSSTILDYLATTLDAAALAPAPADRAAVAEWEHALDAGFGLGVQQLFYATATGADGSIVKKLWSHGGPWWADTMYAVAYPAIATVAKRMYGAQRKGVFERATERFDRTLERVAEQLARTPYMMGEAPGRVDITLAALLAPLLAPAEHPVPWPRLPDKLAKMVEARADHPAFAHTRRMYREHRHAAAPYALGMGGHHEPRAA